MAADAFLNAVDIPAQNVHRIRGEGDPQEAAAAYAADLLEAVGTPPVFDLIMLGMGPTAIPPRFFPARIRRSIRTSLCGLFSSRNCRRIESRLRPACSIRLDM